jgi:hypothetical protein
VARLSRSLVQVQPIIASELTNHRRFFRAQIKHLFQPELASLPADEAKQAVAALDVLCSFESVDLLLNDQNMPRDAVAEVLRRSMRCLLAI